MFISFRNSLLSLDVAIETTNYGLNKALDTSSVFLLKHTKTNSYSILSSKEWIKNFLEFTLDYPDQSIIIPFVWITFGICDTHRCAYNGSYYSLSLGLMIYVIRNNRVVYQKSLSRFTELDGKFQTIDYQACDVRIDSNVNDKLVKQVMIVYTNRLK